MLLDYTWMHLCHFAGTWLDAIYILSDVVFNEIYKRLCQTIVSNMNKIIKKKLTLSRIFFCRGGSEF
jgi:hypothetical protein